MTWNTLRPIKEAGFLIVCLWLLALVLQFVIPGVTIAGSASVSEFIAVLDSKSAVPSRDSPATGKAVFELDDTKKMINYTLTVDKIENVVGAHLHLGKPGKNGPILASLAGPFPPGEGQADGVLAEGTLNVFNLEGPLLSEPGGEEDDQVMAELLEHMRKGRTYVNITTDLGWHPSENRPGKFPKSEIRGQIRPASE